MVAVQVLKEAVEAYLQQLRECARSHDVPIEATLWQHLAAADMVELTVVSRRKAYIFSLPATDLADPHCAALSSEVMGLLLTAIRENISMAGMRMSASAAERHHAYPWPAVAEKDGQFSTKARY